MPIYEYECQACGHQFEVMQKISDKPVRKCESCGKARSKRIVSQTSFLLKGGGWYADAYSAGGKKGGSGGSSDSSGSSSGGSSKDSGGGSSKDSGSAKTAAAPA